ncbi:MAG: hypothetical protein U0X39_03750 [Bacteroidales bacterium]
MKYKISVTLAVMVLLNSIVTAQFSEKRTYSNTFRTSRETTLEVVNKYGTIHITSWKKDSVSVRAEVEASSSNATRPGKMLAGVNITITGTDYLVRARTEFTETINMLFESFKGMTNKLIPYESKIQINYFISMPDYMGLRLENKYGDIYMENNTGSISVNQSNGSFKANSLQKVNDLNLTFCDATINSISTASIDASFSELVIAEAGNLVINSISSRYDIKRCDYLSTESRRDKFFLGDIKKIKGNAYFSDYRIDRLGTEAEVTAKYGSFTISLVGKETELISLNSGYSDVNLTLDDGLSCNLDIRQVNAFLTLPEKNTSTEKKAVSEEKKEYVTFGTIGKGQPKTKIRIDANRGNIFIR